ncbi:MAG: CIA30 family protein [Flavobacteriales bacterium]|jgi:NADH dehydrogenase [ubiquinone] 1 alpha subcomplex assembly factor 1|nr:CIA30 family protein [Flavobacteriales bacterium]
MLQNLTWAMVLSSFITSSLIFDFNKKSDIRSWRIVDDIVMGGRSSGNFSLNAEGHGVFEGEISLENNGGFSSVRCGFEKIQIKDQTMISIKLRGDGKNYQFRIKSNTGDYYSFIMPFSTSGEWQEIEIPLKDMYPSFRGTKLDMQNFSNDYFTEIAFLIGNNKRENFKLIIDRIELK